MYQDFQKHLQQTLKEIEEAGLYKNERVIITPQSSAIKVEGNKDVINFCANRTTKGLAEGTGDDLHFTAEVEALRYTMSGLTHYASRVALIHHHEGIVFLSQLANLIERTYIAVHGEYAIGSDDAEALCLRFLELLLEVGHVGILIAITDSLAEANAVDDRCVIEGIGDNSILVRQERFKKATISIEASGVEDSIFGAEEVRDSALELLMGILRATNETHGSHTITTFCAPSSPCAASRLSTSSITSLGRGLSPTYGLIRFLFWHG